MTRELWNELQSRFEAQFGKLRNKNGGWIKFKPYSCFCCGTNRLLSFEVTEDSMCRACCVAVDKDFDLSPIMAYDEAAVQCKSCKQVSPHSSCKDCVMTAYYQCTECKVTKNQDDMAEGLMRCKTCIKLLLDDITPGSKPSPAWKRKRQDKESGDAVVDTDATPQNTNRPKTSQSSDCQTCRKCFPVDELDYAGRCVPCADNEQRFPCETCGFRAHPRDMDGELVNCKFCVRVAEGRCRIAGSCSDFLAKGSLNCVYHTRAIATDNRVITDSDDEEGTERAKAGLKLNGDPVTDSDDDDDSGEYDDDNKVNAAAIAACNADLAAGKAATSATGAAKADA
jgi:hypothetical protein